MYPSFILSDTPFSEELISLSNHLQIPIQTDLQKSSNDLYLLYSNSTLSLCKENLVLNVDFSTSKKRLQPQNLNGELLVKAAHIKSNTKPLTVLDATAGFGEDSLLLAGMGCDVTLLEYNPIIAALLKNGLQRAVSDIDLKDIISNMHFMEEDSISFMKTISFHPDIIYLDPMFPGRQKSGLIKKKFQLLQLLEMPCGNEEALFHTSLSVKPERIIVKRPQKGPYLLDKKPSYIVQGNSIRYDCYYLGKI